MHIDFNLVPSPSYVIDEGRLLANLKLIKDVQERSGVQFIVAFKGFSMWGVFNIVRQYVQGASASSLYEACLANEEMGVQAHTYCPAYDPADFDEIINRSSHITFNSLRQFHLYKSHLEASEKKISAGLRINPEYTEVATDLYNPCSPGSRLGIRNVDLPETLPTEVEGLHVHALCESPAESTENLLKAVEEKFGRYFSQIKWLNIGGGHLVTRPGYDLEHFIKILKSFKAKYSHLQIIAEPGSAFAWNTGYLVSTILDIVKNRETETAILNVSFTAHMPDCLEMPYQPAIIGASKDNTKPFRYRMGGNSCLAGDYVGDWYFEHELKVGDRIIFEDMIHYTMVKTTMFNGVKHPSIGSWSNETGFKLLRKFNYTDYKNRLS